MLGRRLTEQLLVLAYISLKDLYTLAKESLSRGYTLFKILRRAAKSASWCCVSAYACRANCFHMAWPGKAVAIRLPCFSRDHLQLFEELVLQSSHVLAKTSRFAAWQSSFETLE